MRCEAGSRDAELDVPLANDIISFAVEAAGMYRVSTSETEKPGDEDSERQFEDVRSFCGDG